MHILGPDTLEWMGTAYLFKLGAAETDGRIAIFESVTEAGHGPAIHKHGDADEAFVVLSGDVEFWLEGARTVQGPGATVFVERGAEHAFRVCDGAPARMLTIVSPGGFEEFFREMAEGQYVLPRDMEAVEAVAEKYQLHFTGPPLSGRKKQEMGG
ncbi:cupin domain-containing protein [Alisedimentitalea sp. MJ-SS2]|uniref:cupin domain-containing protein n=1 Tax=Aliisedimentitalea sp. MJ-SS2 TaxID=3049795 RepID=UPI00290C7FED|nr:cupin domain-containing protein [Alisedimentitalea sp. MJ-SS2]MDU8929455.1 cupin domain-containing protein [Alisedimentitalea sp. MJ-SS2]